MTRLFACASLLLLIFPVYAEESEDCQKQLELFAHHLESVNEAALYEALEEDAARIQNEFSGNISIPLKPVLSEQRGIEVSESEIQFQTLGYVEMAHSALNWAENSGIKKTPDGLMTKFIIARDDDPLNHPLSFVSGFIFIAEHPKMFASSPLMTLQSDGQITFPFELKTADVLNYAVWHRQYDLVELLLSAGARSSASLYTVPCAEYVPLALLKRLISSGADPSQSSILVSSYGLSVDHVRLLIEHGAPLEAQDSDGHTALSRYVKLMINEREGGAEPIVLLLLDAGANVHAKCGNTTVINAMEDHYKKLMGQGSLDHLLFRQVLLKARESANKHTTIFGRLAALFGRFSR